MKWSPCSRTDHARPAGVQTRVIERLAILLVRDQDGDRKRSARPSRLPRQPQQVSLVLEAIDGPLPKERNPPLPYSVVDLAHAGPL